MKPKHAEIGVGATRELSLRVSVATLVRVLFEDPREGEVMLALERKATLRGAENGPAVGVKSQPFGGAIRILDPRALRELIGDFHFDSERSQAEGDFRCFIRQSAWAVVRQICLQHLTHANDPILETGPGRELAEEFGEALKISLRPDQYVEKPTGMVVEDDPAPAQNSQAMGVPTARVYRVFEARLLDSSLVRAMLANSKGHSEQDLTELASADARNGGQGRANAILALPLKRIREFYVAMPPAERNGPVLFEGNLLDETVPAVLESISVPKYRRV